MRLFALYIGFCLLNSVMVQGNAPSYPFDGKPEQVFLTNQSGLQISTYKWSHKSSVLPEEELDGVPRAIVVLIHGLENHVRFEYLAHTHKVPTASKRQDLSQWCIYEGSWVQSLNAQGMDVYGIDLQGYGLSQGWQGSRANVEKFDDYIADVIMFLHFIADAQGEKLVHARPNTPVPPMYLVGISLGGNVVLRTLEVLGKANDQLVQKPKPSDRSVLLTGSIALAPMLSVEGQKAKLINRLLLLPISGYISKFFPHLGISKVAPHVKHPWIDEQKILDPLVTTPNMIKARICNEILGAVDRAHAEASFIPKHLRIKIIHSTDDTLCEISGSERFIKSSAAHVSDRSLEPVSGMWHYLTLEPGNENILQSIAKFIVEA